MEIISPINCQFVPAKQIETLNANNIKTFLDFLSAPSEDVCKILEITDYVMCIINKKCNRVEHSC